MDLAQLVRKSIKPFKKQQWFWNLSQNVFTWIPDWLIDFTPDNIIIENTNICNLRCPACPTNNGMYRKKGTMSLDLYRSIIDEFKDFKIKPKISMNFSGEPTIHPEIHKFVEYAHLNGHYTFISTNVTLINETIAKNLISAGLSGIHLCIDGITKESHEAYRVGSKFEQVKANIEMFIRVKKEMGANNPKTIIQTLLTSKSENEKDRLIEWAESIGADGINLKSLNINFGGKKSAEENAHLAPIKEENKRKISIIKKKICSIPLKDAVVYWDGSLGLCCIDYNNVVKMGAVQDSNFLTAFRNSIKHRRRGVLKQYGICKGCNLAEADMISTTVMFNNQPVPPLAQS